MSRQAREKSKSGIYHVMLRGINRQQIFEDPEDYRKFLQILKDYKTISGYKVFAYCLMGNHIHLLIKPEDEAIDQVFKRIAGRYVYWYNIKYQRSGHLFQDRYKSEPVEDDSYFLTVLRYIHQNPVKAKLCKEVGIYKYSSYMEYLDKAVVIDTEYTFQLLPIDQFIEFHQNETNEKCLDINENITIRLTDEQAKLIIKKLTGCNSVSAFQELPEIEKERHVKKLRNKGISIRQLSRLTGMSKGLVEKWIKS